jgi:hypothetical protein
MKRLLLTAIALFAMNAAYAGSASCEAKADEKKLSGAARTSFVTKCDKDAKAAATKTCETQAAEKKLAGAAKTSFTTKCVKDATEAAK